MKAAHLPVSHQSDSKLVQGPAPNKIFHLNKQIIITARKLETGPLENYIHMATLIHKMNLLLLEYDNIKQLRNILKLIFTKQLLNSLIDFCMNTDSFANFGIRLLEILSLEFSTEISNSDILAVVVGLFRTNDYETVVQCLSFVKILAQNILTESPAYITKIVAPKTLTLIVRTVYKQPEIEFISLLVEIVSLVIANKELRHALFEIQLTSDPNHARTYIEFLKYTLTRQEMTLPKLNKAIERQIKELEIWGKSMSS